MMDDTERFLAEAIALARANADRGGRPFGAVVVKDGAVFATGVNEILATGDPTAHAEVLALRRAVEHGGEWRLEDTTLVVTLEPCAMCAGAIVNARVGRLVFGALDAKAGAVASVFDIVRDPRLNHRVEVVSGVHADECAAVLREFFAGHR